MPYKDPERKRQWEREHREQRNARRRAPGLAVADGSRSEIPMPDPVSDQKSESANMIAGLVMGFAFLLILLLAGWRFHSVPEPRRHG